MMNAHYRRLAHERAVLLALVRLAKDKYLPPEGLTEPELTVESDDLPRGDSRVPEDAIIDVLMSVQRLANNIEKEMGEFSFVRMEQKNEQRSEQKRTQEPSHPQPSAPAGQRKSKGGKGNPQAPATKSG